MEESRSGISSSDSGSAPAPTAESTPPSTPTGRAMREEAEHLTGGPGIVMTKSQARGGLGGALLGLFVGALVGLVIGLIAFDGDMGRLVSIVACSVAGLVAGGVAGGITGPMEKMEKSATDT